MVDVLSLRFIGPLRRSRADRLGPTSDHVEWCASPLPAPVCARRQQEGAVRETRKRGNTPPWNCLSRNSALPLIHEASSLCYGLMLAQSRMRTFQVWQQGEFVRIRSVGGWETGGRARRRIPTRWMQIPPCQRLRTLPSCQPGSGLPLPHTHRHAGDKGWLALTCSRPYAAQNCHFSRGPKPQTTYGDGCSGRIRSLSSLFCPERGQLYYRPIPLSHY